MVTFRTLLRNTLEQETSGTGTPVLPVLQHYILPKQQATQSAELNAVLGSFHDMNRQPRFNIKAIYIVQYKDTSNET